ncbi:MAG TPA: class I tRNA ligase family protein, partial [Leptospiraceae bacterium]|nr:class I tRNA ligase family protein [Leptospiraceae bacterium]
ARKAVVEELKSLGLIEKIEDYTHSVGHNSRGGAVIEPYLSTQWFVKVKPLAEKAIEAVRSGKTEFVPKMWEKTYFEWMENIKDWCISRQLWWGHRIPAYYCSDCGHMEVSETEIKKCPSCKSEKVKQDDDVLDTWFSSGLWPFTTMGWPDDTADVKKFYPTSVLVTGFDIIFFWVARMMMFGLKFMNEVPFRKVVIHGLVRDRHGKKFSKSMGNTIDPLDMMSKYGTDSFRFFLAASLPEAKDILFDESRLEGYRAFCNKIWNSSRFILMNLPEDFRTEAVPEKDLESSDLWIQSRFNVCLEKYEKAYSGFHFYEMAALIYDFIWGDFCDWYLELTKPRIYGKSTEKSKSAALQTLADILIKALNLLHPFMPFLTEEIHSAFSEELMTASPWVKPFNVKADSEKVQKIEMLTEIITKVRTVRSELNVPPDRKCRIIIKSDKSLVAEMIHEEQNSLLQLSRAESAVLNKEHKTDRTDSVTAFRFGEIILPLSGLVDMEKEKQRLKKEMDSVAAELEKINKKLNNPEFISKARPEVISKEKEKAEVLKNKAASLEKALERYK